MGFTKEQLMGDWIPLILLLGIPVALMLILGIVKVVAKVRDSADSVPEHARKSLTRSRQTFFPWIKQNRQKIVAIEGAYPLPSSVGIGRRMSLFAAFFAIFVSWVFFMASMEAAHQLEANRIPYQQFLLGRIFIGENDRVYTYIILSCFLFGAIYLYEISVDFSKLMDPHSENNDSVISKIDVGKLVLKDLNDSTIAASYLGERAAAVLRSLDQDPSGSQAEELVNKIIDGDEDACMRAFVAVQWTEAALPILGFIGTALHYGLTLPDLTKALAAKDDPGMASLGKALSNMAIAFDTTLLGLFFLLVIGLWHSKVRKFLDWSIAKTKEALLNLISIRRTTEIIRTSQEIAELRLVLLQQVVMMSEVDRKLGSFQRMESLVQTMIQEGSTPFWKDLKRVAYSSFVEFSQSDQAQLDRRDQFLEGRIGRDRQTIAIGMGLAEQGAVGLAAISRGKEWYFLRFYADKESAGVNERIWQLANPKLLQNPKAIYFNESTSTALALLENDELASIVLPTEPEINRCNAERHAWIPPGGKVVKCLPMTLGKDIYIFALVAEAVRTQVYWSLVAKEPVYGLFEELDFDYTWNQFALDNFSRTLFFAGKRVSDGRWGLVRIPIVLGKDEVGRVCPVREDNLDHLWRNLPLEDKDICSLAAISAKRAIFVDSGGQPWDVSFDYPEPLKVSHGDAGTWSREAKLFPGIAVCLAVVSDNNLTLWSSKQIGRLKKDNLSFAVGDADLESFQTSANRCHLVAISNNRIMTWHFPQIIVGS